MNNTRKKVIFITGVSSGIGEASAISFLKQGYFVIGTYRNPDSIILFEQTYKQQFLGLKLDLTDLLQISNISQQLEKNNINQIDLLINNAGCVHAGPIEFQNFSEIEQMFKTNILGLIYLTQKIIPFLKKSNEARIINISSVAGLSALPFLGVYASTKFALEGFSEALRREMLLYKIKVIVIGPGSIKTPIWGKGFDLNSKVYEMTPFKNSFHQFLKLAQQEEITALPVDRVVQDILKAALKKHPRLRYAPAPRNRFFSTVFIPFVLPKKAYDRLIAKALKVIN